MNLKQEIINPFAGEAFKNMSGGPMLLGEVIISSMIETYHDDAQCSNEEKFKRNAIALKCYKKDETTFTPDEKELIKKYSGRFVSAAAIGAVWGLVDAS